MDPLPPIIPRAYCFSTDADFEFFAGAILNREKFFLYGPGLEPTANNFSQVSQNDGFSYDGTMVTRSVKHVDTVIGVFGGAAILDNVGVGIIYDSLM